jgi:hypothetical protein
MKYSIITNCSSRKRDTGVIPLVPVLSPAVSIAEMAKTWIDQVEQSQIRVAPLDLYQGRSFAECRVATRSTAAEFYVVSAGLGLVHADDLVPNYSLTISEGTGSLQKWLFAQGADSTDWWFALCQNIGTTSPISHMINAQGTNSMHLIALPSSYLEMVAPDLAQVQDDRLQTLRIFTSVAGTKTLPSKLQSAVMPYDERLEGVVNHNGTRSDFPQRALKHFVTHLKGHEHSLNKAKEGVEASMAASVKPTIPLREKVPNERIVELIQTHWDRHEGSASKLLRFLRDDAQIACEQSRFSGIWRKVKEDQSAKGSFHV